MDSLHLAALLTSVLTWLGLALVAIRYFRHARQRTAAKDRLVLSAWGCTLIQLATVGVVPPPVAACAWAGMVLYGLAALLFGWSLLVHGKARPAFVGVEVGPQSFQYRGPYRAVRHPIYTSYLLAWVAAPLMTLQWWLLLPTALMVLLYYRAARREEAHFAASGFAPQYAEYRRRTGMFLPRVIPTGRGDGPLAKAG